MYLPGVGSSCEAPSAAVQVAPRGRGGRVAGADVVEGREAVRLRVEDDAAAGPLGWHFLSHATCLIRPHSFFMRGL